MSKRNRRTLLKGVATAGAVAVGVGTAGTAAADGTAPRGVAIQAREDLEYSITFFHPTDSTDFRTVRGSLSDGEWKSMETEGIISAFYVDGDAALYQEAPEEEWFKQHRVSNPNTKTVIGGGRAEYTIYDGKDNQYSGDVANGDSSYSLDCGIAAMIVGTPGDGYVYLY